MRKRFRQLLVSVAALALLAMAGIGLSAFRAHAAQAPASAQPAKSSPEADSAPEPLPAQSAQPVVAGQVTPNAGASAAGAVENGGSQVAVDCASLLKLATDLKAEVDKTTKDELSVGAVRKAGEIEQLARKVRDTKKN
jgi:hypothetical protein